MPPVRVAGVGPARVEGLFLYRRRLFLAPRSLSGIAPSKQESTTYEPSLVCKLLILGCRLLIPDRLLEADKEQQMFSTPDKSSCRKLTFGPP